MGTELVNQGSKNNLSLLFHTTHLKIMPNGSSTGKFAYTKVHTAMQVSPSMPNHALKPTTTHAWDVEPRRTSSWRLQGFASEMQQTS